MGASNFASEATVNVGCDVIFVTGTEDETGTTGGCLTTGSCLICGTSLVPDDDNKKLFVDDDGNSTAN